MRKKTKLILSCLLLLGGLGVLIYPTLSSYVNDLNGSYAIKSFESSLKQAEPEQVARQRQLAEQYNAALAASDPEQMPEYEDVLDFGGGMMGYIRIPDIDVNLPIYHGVSSTVLDKGIGHMPESAFPIGGSGNHAVLTGHTGLPSARLFTDLTELKLGQQFVIHILEQDLTYEIDQILVVLPHETQALARDPEKDYCTLVTCTPYGINSHRLLVRGVRVEVLEPEAEAQAETVVAGVPMPVTLLAAIGAGIVLLGAIIVLLVKKEKR